MTTTSAQSHLLREVDSLRQIVEDLQSTLDRRNRITLRSARPGAFLGQPATVIARVTDSSGATPRSNVPVTFVTLWGKLRATGNLAGLYCDTVTVRTGEDGTAMATHHSPVAEDLSRAQQGALEAALGALGRDARVPRDVEPGLRQMAEVYNRDLAANLRAAVDSYFEELRQGRFDSVNASDRLLAWSYLDAPVLVFADESQAPEALDDGNDATGQVSAVLTLRFKDWLEPWLQVYRDLAQEKSSLDQGLDDVKQQGGDELSLTKGIYTRIQDYVFSQRGRVGEYLGAKVAEDSVRRFMSSNLDTLSLETRVGLLDALSNAPRTIAKAGAGGIAAASQVRADLDIAGSKRFATNQGVTDAIDSAVTTRNLASSLDVSLAIDSAVTSRNLATSADVSSAIDSAIISRNLASSVDVSSAINGAFSSRDLASSVDVTNAINSAVTSRNLATNADVASAIDSAVISRNLASSLDVSLAIDSAVTSRNLATNADVASAIDSAVISRNLASSVDVTNAINDATRSLATQASVSSQISAATRDLATTISMTSAINSAFSSRDLASSVDVGKAIDTAFSSRDLASSVDVSKAVDSAISARNLASSADVTNAISSATRGLATQASVNSQISSATRDLVTTTSMTSAINSAISARSLVGLAQMNTAINSATSNLVTRDSFTTEITRLDSSVTKIGNTSLATRTDLFQLTTLR